MATSCHVASWKVVHIYSGDDIMPGDCTPWPDQSLNYHGYVPRNPYQGYFCHESLIKVKLNTQVAKCHWAPMSSLSSLIHILLCWITKMSPHRLIKHIFLIQRIVWIRSTITSFQERHTYKVDYIAISLCYTNISNIGSSTLLLLSFQDRGTHECKAGTALGQSAPCGPSVGYADHTSFTFNTLRSRQNDRLFANDIKCAPYGLIDDMHHCFR